MKFILDLFTTEGSNAISRYLKKIGLSPVGLLFFICLAISPLFIDSQYTIHLLISSLMFATLAMGFDLTAGYINIANFGYAALMGTSAYTSAILVANAGISPWIGIIAGTLVAALLGFLVAILTLRLRGMFAAVLAWFVGLTLMALAINQVDLTRGALGINVEKFFTSPAKEQYFYVIFIIMVATYIVLKMVTNSNIGLAFKAIGQDQDAAETIAINPTKYKVINFTISCAVAGLVGGFYAHFIGILTPDVMHTRRVLEILVIAYIGGRGSIWGGIIAALIVIPVFESLRGLLEYRLVIYGLLLIVTMIFYPGGIAGICYWLKDLAESTIRPKAVGK